ncbi:MAG: UbiA family prenyltransferase [Candidatus Freyarchaeota archaeon]|nr:UbiA family prenyltransferase [Candidatus Jordarchaeia archaeon]
MLESYLRLIYNLTRPAFVLIPLAYFLIGGLSTLASPMLFSLNLFWFFRQLVKFLTFTFTLSPHSLISYLAVFLASLSGCNVNTYADSRGSDKYACLKDYSNPIVEGAASPRNVFHLSVTSAVLSVIVGFAVSYFLALIIILGHFFSLTYSYKPRLKGKAPLDLVWNTVGLATLPFIAGYMVYLESPEGLSFSTIMLSIIYDALYSSEIRFNYLLVAYMTGKSFPLNFFLGSNLIGAAFYTLTAALDYEADKSSGLATLAVSLGKKRCLLLGIILCLIGGVSLFNVMLLNAQIALGFSSLLLTFVWALMNPIRERLWSSVKIIALFLLVCFSSEVIMFLI